MIEALDASITVIAMRGPRRPIETAIITVFNTKTMSLDRNSEYLGLLCISSLSKRRDKGNDS